MTAPSVAVLGTLDTKQAEVGYLRDTLISMGARVLVLDAGILGETTLEADVSNERLAAAAGTQLAKLIRRKDRSGALTAMGRGAGRFLLDLIATGDCDGVVAIGGSGGTAIAVAAFSGLPFGLPKVLVSTQVASSPSLLVGHSDVVLVPTVADLAGVNRITSRVLTTAAGAVFGAIAAPEVPVSNANLVFATMIGLTTQGVEMARRAVEAAGVEVITFHATGAGGSALEHLVGPMRVKGMLDLTTIEIADEVVGGVKSAGPNRLLEAGRRGVPQVVATGGVDMVRFGPMSTVPEEFRGRVLHQHTEFVTLMRTTPEENEKIGRTIGERLTQATGPVYLIVPTSGTSALSTEGGVFHDPEADAALFESLEDSADDSVDLVWVHADVNSEKFAMRAAEILMNELDRNPS